MARQRMSTSDSFCDKHQCKFSVYNYATGSCYWRCRECVNEPRRKNPGLKKPAANSSTLCDKHQIRYQEYSSQAGKYKTWMCRLCKNETGRIRRFRTEDGKRWSDNNNAAMRLKPERAIKFKAQQRKKYAEDTEFRQRERDRNKEYRKANPEQHVMHVNAYRSRRKNADGVLELDEWDDVCERYNYKCIDCGSDGPLTVGHAIPLSLGGSNWEDNIIPQCKSCNSKQHANIHPSVNLKTGEVDRSYYVAA